MDEREKEKVLTSDEDSRKRRNNEIEELIKKYNEKQATDSDKKRLEQLLKEKKEIESLNNEEERILKELTEER